MDLHVPQELFQILSMGSNKILVSSDFRLLYLNSEGCIAKLLFAVDGGELSGRSLNGDLLNGGLRKIDHFIEFEQEKSNGYEFDGHWN